MKPNKARNHIYWDHEPAICVVLPQGYDDDLAQSLLEYYGEILGQNVQLVREGSMVYGERFHSLIMVDCGPPSIDPTHRPITDDQALENRWYWWNCTLAYRFGRQAPWQKERG